MNDVIIQIYGIRTVEDARMVVELGTHNIGVSYGKVMRTPGQLTCERAKEIFEGVQPHAVKIGLTISEDIEEITENLNFVLPDILHLSGDIDGITPNQVLKLKKRFPTLKIMQAIPVLENVPLEKQKVIEYVKNYEDVSDLYLIDTKSADVKDIEATGLVHDRYIDKAIVESTKVTCIIAGGLDHGNVAEAIRITKPYGVDSFSLTNLDNPIQGEGCKDPQKVKDFIEAANNAWK